MTTLLPIALGLLLQSTALLLLGLLALRLTRRRGPAVQSLVGRATLAGVGLTLLLAAPLTGRVRPLWHVTLPAASVPSAPDPGREDHPPTPNSGGARNALAPLAAPFAPTAAPTPPELGAGGRSLPVPATPPAPPRSLNSPVSTLRASPLRQLYPALAAAWGMGTALLLLWLGVCQRHLTRLRRQAQPITSSPAADMLLALTPHPPALLAHPSVRSPFLAGLWRPAIFLPATYATDFDPTALRAILAHELAHLARRDNAWTLAARLLSALLWPQPLLWVLCRRLEQISEEACDQAVLAHDCPPRAYADCLLTLAERHPLGRRERALGAGVAPFRSSLGQRIGRILDKGTHAMSTVSPRLRLTIAALTLAAALGGMFLVSSAPAQSPGPATAAPTLEQQRLNATRLQDMSNLKQIGLALTQYAQDHNEHFPNAAHWMDALSPYLKDKTVFFDPFQPGARRYGYALNRNCSGKSLAAFAAPAETVIAFDSTLGTRNASDTGQSLRATVLLRSGGIPGSIYLFVDGHVKWFSKAYLPPFAINQRMSRPHANKGYTVQSYIGAAPVGPARVISEADMAARRNFLNSFTPPDQALSTARFLAGLTPVQGPGVVVTLNDSKKKMPANMPPGLAPANIIHDTDINAVVNELKAAGAEAIAVNDQRLVATSPIRCAGPTVYVNNIPMAPPFSIAAIGSPKALAAIIAMPGGVASQIKAFDPAMFSVREAATLTLPAYSGESGPRYARPLAEETALRGASDFLAGQIAILQPRQRLAEEALVSYKAHHRARPDQRKLADLMRAYNTKTMEYQALLMRLSVVKVQLDVTKMQKQRLDQSASSEPGVATLLQPSASSSARASLLQQRDHVKASLNFLNAQAAALTAQIRMMRVQTQQAMKKMPPPGAGTQEMTRTRAQALVSHISAAQVDLDQKEVTLGPKNQAVIAAKYKVQSLERAYQELPIREKQEFVKEVHQYVRKRGALINALAGENKAMSRQLSSVRRQQSQLQSQIALLNLEIIRQDGSTTAR